MNLAVANKPLLPAKPGESDNASSLLGDSNQATLPSCGRETALEKTWVYSPALA